MNKVCLYLMDWLNRFLIYRFAINYVCVFIQISCTEIQINVSLASRPRYTKIDLMYRNIKRLRNNMVGATAR